MNRVLLKGKVEKVDIFFTPEGERLWRFLLYEEEGNFNIAVYYKGKIEGDSLEKQRGKDLMLIGMLSQGKKKEFVIKAEKILLKEE